MSKPPSLAPPTDARAYRLGTARGEFAVLDCGAPDRGTALLLPGFTGSKEDFIGLLEPLADAGFRAVAADGRGQYETGGPPAEGAYAQTELARDVLALARSVAPHGPLPHLLGHSLGGLVARAAVLRDQACFASLTLMSCGPAAVSASQQRRVKLLQGALSVLSMEEIWQAMRELDQSHRAAGEAPYSAAEEAEISPDMEEFLHRRWLTNVPEQLGATAQQLLTEPDRTEELAALGLPLHVVSGSVDDAWPVPLLDEMAVRLGARRTTVAGAGHSPNAERPGETARALAGFWDALSPCPCPCPCPG